MSSPTSPDSTNGSDESPNLPVARERDAAIPLSGDRCLLYDTRRPTAWVQSDVHRPLEDAR